MYVSIKASESANFEGGQMPYQNLAKSNFYKSLARTVRGSLSRSVAVPKSCSDECMGCMTVCMYVCMSDIPKQVCMYV